MSSLRTFVAIEASLEIRGHAARLIERLRRAEAKVKWIAPENLHLTLKFLGDVPEEHITEICNAVSRSAAHIESFQITCRGAGAFPDLSRPRTVWVGIEQGCDQLCELQSGIEKALSDLGFHREGRRFRPHLTIGRVRGGGPAAHELGQLIQKCADFDAGKGIVDEIVVFSSELGPKGPTYTPLSRVPLP